MEQQEQQRILNIRVKYDDALQGIAEYQKKIDELKVREMQLNAQFKQGVITRKEYSKEMEATGAVVKQYKENVRVLQKEIQNNLRQEQAQEGSLKSLRAELSNLTKQYDELGRVERTSAKGQELQEKINQVTTELKQAEEETQRFYRNVGNYNGAVKPLKQELKELTLQLAQMEREGLRGSDAYNEIAQRAGALKDNIADANAEIKRYASDTRLLDDVTNIVTTGATAWQTYQGAVQAFGVESKEAMEAMAKLQGIMAMTNGLQQLHARFTDNSTATYKIFHKVLQLVGLEEKAVAVSTQEDTAATIANTTAQGANAVASKATATAKTAEATATNASTVAMTGASVAAKVLRVALMTLGIGLVVTALGALVAYWDDVVDFFKGVTAESKRAAEMEKQLAEVTDEASKAYAKASAEIESYQNRINSFNGTKEQESKLVKELNEKYGKAMGYYSSLAKWKEVLQKNGKAYCEMLLKEAEAQGILNKYTEAYINLLEVRRKAASGEYDHWYNTKAGDAAARQKEINAAEADMNKWLEMYKAKMKEAESVKLEFNFGDYTDPTKGSKSGKDKKDDSAKEAQERARREREEVRKAEDLMLQLVEQNYERQRQAINNQYDRQIEDIRTKLAQEKNLTQNARAAMLAQVESLEQLKGKKLEELSRQQLEKDIAFEQERIKLMLDTVSKGSLAEYDLKVKQLQNEQELAIARAEQEYTNERERGEMILSIRQSYNAKLGALNDELNNAEAQRISDDFQTRILQASDNELEQTRLKMEERKALLDAAMQEEGETTEQFNLRKLQLEDEYQQAKQSLTEKEIEVERAKFTAISGFFGGLSQVAEAFGEDSKGLAQAAKILALGEIAINTGVALAAGIKQAQSVPFPANIAAIATTVTTILANVASAIKTVKSAKFAHGGLVSGEGTATSDSIPAMLSNGESVMTAQATSMFAPALSAFNQLGGGVPIVVSNPQTQMGEDMLASAIAKGFAAAPRPVVGVEEFTEVQNRLEVIEGLSSI